MLLDTMPGESRRKLEALMFPEERLVDFLIRVVDMLPPRSTLMSDTPFVFTMEHAEQIRSLIYEVGSIKDALRHLGSDDNA